MAPGNCEWTGGKPVYSRYQWRRSAYARSAAKPRFPRVYARDEGKHQDEHQHRVTHKPDNFLQRHDSKTSSQFFPALLDTHVFVLLWKQQITDGQKHPGKEQ